MNYGTELPDFGDIWRDLQTGWDGKPVARTVDDEVELRFWKPFIHDKGPEGFDQYSRKVWEAVEGILGDRYFERIIEIGPGWGNYTMDLASRCNQLVCVDMSADVLRHIASLSKQFCSNVKTVRSKWEDYRGGKVGMVFGFNCFYRMSEIEECLSKIDRLGEFHVIGMTSGPEREYYRAFETELGLKIRYTRLDYIVLVNVLYQLGIDVNVKIVDLEKDYAFGSVEMAAKKACRRIISENYSMDDIMRIMSRYLEKGDDGLYHYLHRFKAAIIYW